MKRSFLVAWLPLLLLFGGCMATPQQQRTERDLAEMKRRLAELERSVAARQQDDGQASRLEALSRRQADLQAGLDALRVELQAGSGRLEDLAHQSAALRDELGLVRDDLGLKLTAIEERVARLEERPAVAAPPPPPAESPEDLYLRGLELIQKGEDFARGQQALKDFLQRHPGHELAVNALYWIGEAYYGEKKYENAILQFQDVIQKHPDHPKVPAALLKQGLAFHALGDVKNARVILRKVVDSYPRTEEAAKAKEKLEQWPGA